MNPLLLLSLLIVPGFAILPPCGKDFVYNEATDKCYHFSTECAKFGEAERVCRKMNTNLTAIRTKAENEIIYDLAQLNFPVEQKHFWLGARVALTDPPQFVWLTGEDFGFHRLYNPFSSQQDSCVAASLTRNQWVAGSCAECFHFLCEAKREQITCPQGYSYFNKTNACYKFMSEEADWAHHEAKCVEEGGHLVSFHSTDETLFVEEIAGNVTKIWIGAKAETVPDFQWSDNTMWSYTNWHPTAPNTLENFKCVLAYGKTVFAVKARGTWNNSACTVPMPAVCKFVGVKPKPEPTLGDSNDLPLPTGEIFNNF
ncbi:hypothetical protein L596_017901 [Steinernema carpocapsae]|uniref:C-type lectin domain-containing protein n=1 Tax=Steinernema carpocapsae TaxID=34508 RepID=A0A4U5N3A5_STECR|nr:hypothetical protein L596_017901 [Steinernema carpocapsae]